MKKLLIIILATVLMMAVVPFAVNADEAGSYAVSVCRCPIANRITTCRDLGNGRHAIECMSCGLQISTEPHTLSEAKCGESQYCFECDYSVWIDHNFSEIENFGETGHGCYCSNYGCEYNPASDTDGDPDTSFIGLYNFESHYSSYPETYTTVYEYGEYWHIAIWECDVCDYIYCEDHLCLTQRPDCQGGCFNHN